MPGSVPDSGNIELMQSNVPALRRLLSGWANGPGYQYVPVWTALHVAQGGEVFLGGRQVGPRIQRGTDVLILVHPEQTLRRDECEWLIWRDRREHLWGREKRGDLEAQKSTRGASEEQATTQHVGLSPGETGWGMPQSYPTARAPGDASACHLPLVISGAGAGRR